MKEGIWVQWCIILDFPQDFPSLSVLKSPVATQLKDQASDFLCLAPENDLIPRTPACAPREFHSWPAMQETQIYSSSLKTHFCLPDKEIQLL